MVSENIFKKHIKRQKEKAGEYPTFLLFEISHDYLESALLSNPLILLYKSC
jgi:hypothetical protein